MECEICSKVPLYEDGICKVILPEKPLCVGHLKLVSKKHREKIEDFDEKEFTHFFTLSSVLSSVIFEVMKAQGTNIICLSGEKANNETGHLEFNILPRFESDNLGVNWIPKPADREVLEVISQKIKDEAFYIGKETNEKESNEESIPSTELPENPHEPSQTGSSEENPLIKQLKRLP